MKKKIINYIH